MIKLSMLWGTSGLAPPGNLLTPPGGGARPPDYYRQPQPSRRRCHSWALQAVLYRPNSGPPPKCFQGLP